MVVDDTTVAKVTGGDGHDDATETVAAAGFESQVVTMQIVENVVSGSSARLQVIDAQTGVRLGESDVEIAANVIVEDEL